MSKKIMDERGRLFGVINIIDVIVILLAVVLVCCLLYTSPSPRD